MTGHGKIIFCAMWYLQKCCNYHLFISSVLYFQSVRYKFPWRKIIKRLLLIAFLIFLIFLLQRQNIIGNWLYLWFFIPAKKTEPFWWARSSWQVWCWERLQIRRLWPQRGDTMGIMSQNDLNQSSAQLERREILGWGTDYLQEYDQDLVFNNYSQQYHLITRE